MKRILHDILKSSGKFSEKRVIRFGTVIICLTLTLIDFFYNQELRLDVLIAWLGYVSYEGTVKSMEKIKMSKQVTDEPTSDNSSNSAVN